MKAIVNTLLSVSMSILLVAVPVRSQSGPAQDGDSLKARIERLESTDVKSKSSTVQLIYKRSLLRMYNQYSAALEEELKDLRNIQKVVGDADSKMRREVAASIQKLTSERDVTAEKIETLTGDLRATVASEGGIDSASAAAPPARVGPARGEQVSYTRTERPAMSTRAEEYSTVTTSFASVNSQPSAPLNGTLTPAFLPQPQGSGSGSTPQTNNTQQENMVQVDWASRTAGCPARVTQSTRVTFRVTNINDVLFDFSSGATFTYALDARGSRRSQMAPTSGLDILQSGRLQALTDECSRLMELLNSFQREASRNSLISRSARTPGGASVRLIDSLNAAHGLTIDVTTPQGTTEKIGIQTVINALSQTSCEALKNHPFAKWLERVQGPHIVDLSAIIEPDKNYDFTITENWIGTPTAGGKLQWDCGENDVFTLSLGPVISTLPSRTYEQQRAPVPAGSTTVKNILTVGNTTNVNVLGAALINYHFQRWRFLPGEIGLGLSAGPVYTLGSTPDVSALGLFVGPTIHLTRSLFLTPGIHIGEFADFPAGFTPGAEIPTDFGTLNPVKRRTAKFAFGITYRTNSFKKSSGDEGTGGNATAGGGSGGTQATSGSPGSGGGQPTGGSPGSGGGGTSQPTPSPLNR